MKIIYYKHFQLSIFHRTGDPVLINEIFGLDGPKTYFCLSSNPPSSA
jgi:hypothetical protein